MRRNLSFRIAALSGCAALLFTISGLPTGATLTNDDGPAGAETKL